MTATNNIDWVRKFFGEGNAWSLEKIENSDYPGTLQTQLETMLHACLFGSPPFVLPRVDSNKSLYFYIVGGNTQQLSEFRRVLEAFLGRVNTILDPRIYLASDDEIEKSLLKEFSHGFLKVLVPPSVSANKPETYSIFATLNLARQQYSKRPPGLSTVHRPTGRILSDFIVACSRNDGVAAFDYFQELSATDRLSPRNLISLELQALAANGNWSELLAHPRLADIVAGRIPGTIEEIILDAVGHTALCSNDLDEYKVDKVRQSLEKLSPLFLNEPDLLKKHRADLWNVWSIGAAAFGNIRVFDSITVQALGQDWIERLSHWADISRPEQTPGDHLASTLRAEPSLDNALSLLQRYLTANHKEGLQIYRRILEYPSETLDQILAHGPLSGVWGALEAEYESPVETGSWSGWLRSLTDDKENALSIESIAESCKFWEANDWDEQDVIDGFYKLADSEQVALVREVLPILRGWLIDNQIPMSAVLIEAAAVILSSDDVYSIQDLGLFSEFIDALTEDSHTKSQYCDLVDAAKTCWERVQSTNSIELGLEVMDALLDCVCADPQARLKYWNSLQNFCIANWSRIPRDQQLVILRSSEDATESIYQFPRLAEEKETAVGNSVDLSNKRLAIYTLTEGAARRAGAVLEELFPSLDIRLNHDKSATTALVNLAKTADYFIFSSRSAAHQAFYPVTKERDDILYPAGKGSSSIVRCFLDAVQG